MCYETGQFMCSQHFPPTDQELEVKALLHEQLREHLGALDAMVANEVEALNEMLRARGMLIIAD